jgi:hypothetical protein
MTKNVKLAILRARHDTTRAKPGDADCLAVLRAHADRLTVLQYWTDVTDGYLDFTDGAMLPWVDITLTSADSVLDTSRTPIHRMIPRPTEFQRACDALALLPGAPDLSQYDGFVLLLFPGTSYTNPYVGQPGFRADEPAQIEFEGGTIGIGHGAYAVFPMATSTLSFMCHEVGHLLGLEDAQGVRMGTTSTGAPDYGYGDPFDVMSAEVFAYAGSSFLGVVRPGWPIAHERLGPAPSRAHLHFWDPASIPASAVRELQVPGAGVAARLHAAYDGGTPRLLIIRPPSEPANGLGRCYIEYRHKRGWDSGLEHAGTTLDRRSVVVHVVLRLPSRAPTAPPVCWYRGRVVVPAEVDSDLSIPGTPFTVRVVGSDTANGYVDVQIRSANPLGLELVTDERETTVISRGLHEQRRTPCGDTLSWGHWTTRTVTTYQPISWGLGGEGLPDFQPGVLDVAWVVGGVALNPAGTLAVGCNAPEGTFNIAYTIDPGTQTLHLDSQGVTYHMPVQVTVRDPRTGGGLTQTTTYAPRGGYTGYPPGDVEKLLRCEARLLGELRINPADFVVPTRPRPPREWARDVPLARDAVIAHVRGMGPALARQVEALEQLVALRREP